MLDMHSLLAGILIIPSHARAGNGVSPLRPGTQQGRNAGSAQQRYFVHPWLSITGSGDK